MRPFSHFQPILQLDLRRPLTLINKWGFPCCIYDPILVEIHQSMWKLEPNVNLFSQQTTTTDNRQQLQWTKWSLCVFPTKAGDTKIDSSLDTVTIPVRFTLRFLVVLCLQENTSTEVWALLKLSGSCCELPSSKLESQVELQTFINKLFTVNITPIPPKIQPHQPHLCEVHSHSPNTLRCSLVIAQPSSLSNSKKCHRLSKMVPTIYLIYWYTL